MITTQLAGSTMTGVLKFNNIVANKVISLYDAATPNNFQFVGIGANNGLVLNTFASGDAFQFRVGATTTSSIELMRLTGTGNLGIGTTDTSVNILQVGKGGRLKIGNGAGLVMSTLDVVAYAGEKYGVKPANFLDIGGGDTVAKAISDELGTDVKVLARVSSLRASS